MNKHCRFLDQLSETLSHEVVQELLLIFDRQHEDLLGQLIECIPHQDLKLARELAHSMKSSAANVGALEVATLYQALEKDTKSSLNEITLHRIEVAYQRYKNDITSWKNVS